MQRWGDAWRGKLHPSTSSGQAPAQGERVNKSSLPLLYKGGNEKPENIFSPFCKGGLRGILISFFLLRRHKKSNNISLLFLDEKKQKSHT
jgi:hypothetical protein